MRNPLKRSPTADPKPTLRERFAAMKARAAGLTFETSQGRRAVLTGSLAAALPLPALAASGSVASDGRGVYLTRLLTVYAEDRACRPIANVAVNGSIEERACRLVMWRCWDLCMEILELPAPQALDGLALAALASAIELEVSYYGDDDRNVRAAIALTRAVLALTRTALPLGFAGFGDEPDCSDRDKAGLAIPGNLPAWAIAEAEAADEDDEADA